MGTSLAAWSMLSDPAFAANECGPPPPGGGTVTCPPGDYPNGIDYEAVEDLTVVLEPGVTAAETVQVTSLVDADLRIEGETGTTIGSTQSGYGAGEGVNVSSPFGTVFVGVDDVATTGASQSRGIVADSKYGTTVIADTVSTQGEESIGIRATTGGFKYGGGPVSVTSNSVVTVGDDSTGIFARGTGGSKYGESDGSVTVDSGSVLTSGDRSGGIFATSDGGPVSITSVTLTTEGDGSNGIEGRSDSGDVTIGSGDLTTVGENSIGIFAETGPGAINITSVTLETTGANAIGILALTRSECICAPPPPPPPDSSFPAILPAAAPIALPPDISITSGTVTTAGAGDAHGILAYTTDGDIHIESGSVTTAGDGATGILAATESGSITIDSGTVATTGDYSDGIYAYSEEGGVVVISDSVTTGGLGSVGIAAGSTFGDVTVDSGSVETGQDFAIGIAAGSELGSVSVTSDSVTTSGDFAVGIAAGGKYGPASVDSGTVVTSGDLAIGIAAGSLYDSVLVESGSVSTSGEGAVGILAGSKYGDVAVDSGSVVTSGDGAIGIIATNNVGDRKYGGGGGTTAISGDGIGTLSHLGGGAISVTSDSVVTSGDGAIGIFASSGSETKYGGGSTGDIVPLSEHGGGVTITSGSVSTSGDDAPGIVAYGETVTIVSSTVTTTGDGSTGIFARSFGLDDGKYSEAEGISVQQVGPGGVFITSGSVTTTGANSPGIDGASATGDVEIVSTGTVTTTGTDSDGIVAASDTGFVIVDSNAVNVSGAGSDGIVVSSATSSNITIRGLNRSTQGFTIQADGGAATVGIVGGGTVRGRIDLTDVDDIVNNAGTFDAIGTSLFGAGSDVFNNNAGGTIRSLNGAAALSGLETFNNRNRVELRDGAAGDTLTISGTFNGLGGSRLGVDVDFAAELADILFLGTATGTTAIDVAVVGVGGILADPILVVDASAGTGSGAFTLAGGSVSNGFVRTSLIFDAPNFNFLLATSPEQPVFETAKIGQIGTNIWYLGADALSAQLEGSRDGGFNGGSGGSALAQESASGETRKGLGFWVQGVLGDSEVASLQTFGNAVFDVSYEQDYLGIQGGLDYSVGRARLGITFGTGNADSTFQASGNTLDVDDKNVGAYVAVNTKGGFFFNALAKMDWLELKANPGPGLETEFEGRAFGFLAEAGMRFGLGNMFVEPSVGISWVNTDFDEIVSGPAIITVEDVRSMRARAGLRLGGDFAMGSGTFSPFAGVQVYEELEGDNTTSFVLGQTLTLVDEPPGSRAVFNLGTSFRTGAFEAFVRGDLDFGDQDGKSIRAGVRLRF